MSVEDIRCLAILVDREDSKASSVFRTAKRNMKEGKGRREEVEGDRGWSGYQPPFNASTTARSEMLDGNETQRSSSYSS